MHNAQFFKQYDIFFLENLVEWKNSSTFAPHFDKCNAKTGCISA